MEKRSKTMSLILWDIFTPLISEVSLIHVQIMFFAPCSFLLVLFKKFRSFHLDLLSIF